MDRRELLKGAAGGLILAAAGNAVFAAEDHAGHQHTVHKHTQKNQSLIDAAANGVKIGQACLQHSLEMLSEGENKGMAVCAMRVTDMIAACTAIEQLANYHSPHLPKMARVVMDICSDCEKECRKCEKEMEICKLTAESCVICFNECKKIAV